ncbi:MAG: hypothetical protein CVU38_11345 [Chloroflexi bacterium HGW-Chloroflexi-1]|nr:MAG: hypothetical protein CVU38_11345 [Chloroflexi bacterium HGW-Chloroflexi-1]
MKVERIFNVLLALALLLSVGVQLNQVHAQGTAPMPQQNLPAAAVLTDQIPIPARAGQPASGSGLMQFTGPPGANPEHEVSAYGFQAGDYNRGRPLAASDESEPNDTPGTAHPLSAGVTNTGSINPIGDIDYYSLGGVNTAWGFIALLDTYGSTASKRATLTALRNDGTTVLQTDTGSWERGSGIALQNYADSGLTHYLLVNEEGNDAAVTPYTLRYYKTIIAAQPEVEPNDTPAAGTPSSFTHSGVISSMADVDCFAFQGRVGDTILLALNGDPEGNGSDLDPALDLVDPSGVTLKSANVSGMAGNEFIEYVGLSSAGVYAYCVRAAPGAGLQTDTYKVGLVRNGGLYFPDMTRDPTWLNPRPGNYARPGDILSFRLAITNASPIMIPGNIRLTATYSPTCLSVVTTTPTATLTSPGYISWDGQKTTGLAPGETYSVTMDMLALTTCSDNIYQDTGVSYYYTGHNNTVDYSIHPGADLYLPLIQR